MGGASARWDLLGPSKEETRGKGGGREEEGEPVWTLLASSLPGSASWDGQFYHPTSQILLGEHGGSEPG